MLTLTETALPGVVIVESRVFEDERGFFMETYNEAAFVNAGLPGRFVQDNHSRSARGVLRGLHYQYPQWQGKLVRAVSGEILDIAVDIRRQSPTYAQWVGVTLSGDNRRQLYIPPGYAHGFCVLSEVADMVYKCTSGYKPSDDGAIRWDDPEIGIEWPVDDPTVSAKDAAAPHLHEINID